MSELLPELRFSGFSDDWVQRKLSELLKERNLKIEPNVDYELMSFIAGSGVTPKGERYDRSALVTNDSKKYKVTEFGDFIYSSNNLETGSIGFNKTGRAVISPVYSIFYSTENADSRFIGLLSNQNKFINSMVRYRQGVVYGQWRIHESDFLKIEVSTPKLDEQKLIIEFFERFDNTIALHQRELDLLKSVKTGLLQKMFPSNGESVPKLRFANFDDEWVQRKLSDISEKVTEKNSDNEFSETLTNSAEYGIISQRDFFNKNISNDKNLNTYYIVHDGDFVYNPRISNFAPVGPIKRNTLGRTGVMSPLYYIFRTHDVNGMYLEKYFSSTKWYRFMELNGDTGARSDRFAIKDKDFVQILIPLPSLEEQEKIGAFFKKLDDTITLHQRQLDLLKLSKKGLLQKMFV